jgi:hypothetical protein
MAFKLRGIKCESVEEHYHDQGEYDNLREMLKNNIICGGFDPKTRECFYSITGERGLLTSRCKMSQADAVFMFLTAIVVAGAAILGYMRLKRGY